MENENLDQVYGNKPLTTREILGASPLMLFREGKTPSDFGIEADAYPCGQIFTEEDARILFPKFGGRFTTCACLGPSDIMVVYEHIAARADLCKLPWELVEVARENGAVYYEKVAGPGVRGSK